MALFWAIWHAKNQKNFYEINFGIFLFRIHPESCVKSYEVEIIRILNIKIFKVLPKIYYNPTFFIYLLVLFIPFGDCQNFTLFFIY